MKTIKSISVIILCLTLGCCINKSDEKVSSKSKGIVEKSKLLKGWKTFEDEKIKVNIPESWHPKTVDDLLLYVPVSKDNSNLYYAILRHDATKMGYKDYIKEVFRQVSTKDSTFTYYIREVKFENDNKCYALQFFTNEDGIKYKTYSLIYESGNQLYDFSYKTINDELTNSESYNTFYTVLFSFEVDYDNVIDGESFLVRNDTLIKYSDL